MNDDRSTLCYCPNCIFFKVIGTETYWSVILFNFLMKCFLLLTSEYFSQGGRIYTVVKLPPMSQKWDINQNGINRLLHRVLTHIFYLHY